jgi:hypothetical protein
MAYGGSFPCYGGSGMYSILCGSYGARPPYPFHGGQFGWLSYRDVPPFIIQRHGVPLAPEHVSHAAALVASTLGEPVPLLDSLLSMNFPPPLPSDLTVSVLGYSVGPHDVPPASFHVGIQ